MPGDAASSCANAVKNVRAGSEVHRASGDEKQGYSHTTQPFAPPVASCAALLLLSLALISPAEPAMKPRLGLPTDVDPITHVILSAMPQDPAWVYRFPYRREYPQDHYKYTRMLFEYFLDPAYDDWVVMVIEDALESGRATEIVAFGVFNVSFRNKRAHGPGYQAQDPAALVDERGGRTRRDASRRRLDAFTHEQVEAYKRFFEPIGPEQIHLQILATLPAFQRRGHGSSICKWAMSLARDENLKDISVMASPMGHELYNWLGFQRVGEFPIRVPDEEVELTLVAMMYDPGA